VDEKRKKKYRRRSEPDRMLSVSTFAFLLIKILRLSLLALGISLLEVHFSFQVIFGLRHLQDIA